MTDYRRRSGRSGIRRGMRRAAFVPYSVMATRFDGVDESADIGDVAALKFTHTDPFSISVWFKTLSGSNMFLFSKKIASGGVMRGYGLITNNNRFDVELHNDRGSNEINVAFNHANGLYQDDEWHHVVMTYDGSTNASGVALYVDGAALTPTINDDTLTATIDDVASASIASQNNESRFFEGDVDEVTAWDKALDLAEVGEMFDDNGPVELINHSAIANLVGWWRLGDEDAFPVITDLSVSGNDATLLNMEGADFVSAEHPP